MPAAGAEHAANATTILVFGLRPERLIDSEGRIDAFVEPPGQEQVPVLVEAVRSGLQGGGSVVAIVPEWIGSEALHPGYVGRLADHVERERFLGARLGQVEP